MAFLPEKTYIDETLTSGYDFTNGTTSFTSSDVSKYVTLSLQFIYSNSDSKNSFVIEQSNDSINWGNLSQNYSLSVGSGNFIIDKGTFSGKHIRVTLVSTGHGTLTIKLLAKK